MTPSSTEGQSRKLGRGKEALTMPADHLDNESALCLVWLVMNMALATLNRRIFVPRVT